MLPGVPSTRACGFISWLRASGVSCGDGSSVSDEAGLARPNTLPFAPLAIGWWVWAERGRTRGDAGAAQRRGSLAGAAALGCGLVLAIAPATLRNQWVTGEFTLISSQAEITLFHGNNPDGYGLFASGGANSGNPLTQSADQRRIAEQAAGRPLTQSEVGRCWLAGPRRRAATRW